MSMFGKRPNGVPDPETFVTPREWGRCPKCQAIEITEVCVLKGWTLTGKGYESHPIGMRLSCQRCPHIFSVGPSGIFDQHVQSLPAVMQLQPARPREEQAQQTTRTLPPRDEAPIPRRPPPQ